MTRRARKAAVLVWLAAVLGVVAGGSASGSRTSAPLPVSPYYLARGDPRLCPSPVCGGLFVHLENRSRTICGDGARRLSCYVAAADLAKLRVPDAERTRLSGLLGEGRALARGTLVRGLVKGFPQLDTLVVTEVWPASSSQSPPTGTFRRLRDNGVRCIAAPCFATDAIALNNGGKVTVSRVGLAGVRAPAGERTRALALVTSGRLLAAGRIVAVPQAGPAGTGRVFVASQFYAQAR